MTVIEAAERFHRQYGREPLIPKRTAVEFLGISTSKVEKLTASRQIPSYPVGGRRMYRLSELDAWVTEQREREG